MVSSVNGYGETPKDPPKGKKSTNNSFEAFRQEALLSFKKFKDDTHKEYNEFREGTIKEYEDFKDGATGSVPEENPTVYTVKQEKPVTTGLPTEEIPHLEQDENGNYVNNYYDSTGKLVKSEPAKKITPEQAPTPAAETPPTQPIEETKPVQGNVAPQPTPEETLPEKKPEMVQVSREGVSGSYAITAGKNGEGFQVTQKMAVALYESEVYDFFFQNKPGETFPKRDKDGKYHFRGMKSENYNILENKKINTAQKIAMNNAIYNDLLTKQKAGTELSNPEKLFIEAYKKQLTSYDLGVDENGNLYDLEK